MNDFEWILLILTTGYSVFLAWCYAGWRKLPQFVPASAPKYFITVIVPARDEENTIVSCLESLFTQDYPKDLFEVVVVDDDSSDQTSQRVRDFLLSHPAMHGRLLSTDSFPGKIMPYKKQAITLALAHAKGDLIVCTDADCVTPVKWLSSLAAVYTMEQAVLVSGPVLLTGEKSLLDKMQSLEFLGLIGIGAASIGQEQPMMCNGASMAYDKSSFASVEGYANDVTASGDDTQLLKKLHSRYPGKIKFLKSADAAVLTHCKKTLPELLQQRARWSSKIPARMSILTVCIAAIAFLLHAGILVAIVFGVCRPYLLVLFWGMKAVMEYLFLWSLASFFGKKKLLRVFLPAQLVYPVYIAWTGLLALRGTYVWKGRKQVARI